MPPKPDSSLLLFRQRSTRATHEDRTRGALHPSKPQNRGVLRAVTGLSIALGLLMLFLPQVQAVSPSVSGKVTFTETGLAPGSHWQVTLNGVSHSSNGPTIAFREPAGNYSYSIRHHLGYHSLPLSGHVLISAGNLIVPVTFISNGANSANVSNFNGTNIPAGDYIWFSSVFTPKSTVPSGGMTLHVTNQSITLSFSNGTRTVLRVPDSLVTFSPSSTSGSLAFSKGEARWHEMVPVSFTGDTFLSGLAYQVPAGGIPGGVSNVTWSANFGFDSTSHTQSFGVNWQWAAAVYTNFTTDYNALEVKPLHSTSLDSYHNGDQPGTPEAYSTSVIGGARGGGGSNFTGSYSGTVTISAPKD
jgi:hypothetical protein